MAQSEQHKIYSGISDAAKQIYLKEGKTVFFRGLTPTIIQVAPHAGAHFMAYNVLDSIYRSSVGLDSKTYSALGSVFAGGFSGLFAKTVIYPLDLMKKRLQVQGFQNHRIGFGKQFVCRGLLDCLRHTMKEEGMLGLFKGLSPSLYKAVFSSALHFGAYELICKIISDIR